MIGLPFLFSGLGKVASYSGVVAMIDAAGLPFAPPGWVIAVLVEIGGGLLLLLGFRVGPVAIVVALFTLATAIVFHRNFADQNQMIHFLKNVMLAGGLLQIAHFGAGAFSLDARGS
ncbi:DoxX family protein [Bradyrhizobium sp. Ash2021]|uniref:DoxX family protein n=1 Tax=Bradyrhizobium sp. Ash2021 TaxID=2954771 RepID=UPI002814D6A0|nr:DoxX family protein [Bradyrhizobium sp. Ash2021]WMT76448.1 DoxX family protein [Bradyrhizobium sp. Ash2021]